MTATSHDRRLCRAPGALSPETGTGASNYNAGSVKNASTAFLEKCTKIRREQRGIRSRARIESTRSRDIGLCTLQESVVHLDARKRVFRRGTHQVRVKTRACVGVTVRIDARNLGVAACHVAVERLHQRLRWPGFR